MKTDFSILRWPKQYKILQSVLKFELIKTFDRYDFTSADRRPVIRKRVRRSSGGSQNLKQEFYVVLNNKYCSLL